MKFMNDWWGIEENLSPVDMLIRASAMFVIALLLMRMTGMRAFSKDSSIDNIILFLIGGILSRGVVGASPFFSTVAAAIGIILVHKLIAKLSLYSRAFEKTVKGNRILLYDREGFKYGHMLTANISKGDIFEDLRLKLHTEDLGEVEQIFMEETGSLSFIRRSEASN